MLTSDSLRQILQAKAITSAGYLSLPVRIGDEAFTPPTDGSIWAHFFFVLGKTKPIEVGGRGRYQCTVGVAQFSLYGPEGSLDGELGRFGDQLKNMWDQQQWIVPPDGYVTMEPFGARVMDGVFNGHRVCIVDGAFDFYHHNPNLDDRLS